MGEGEVLIGVHEANGYRNYVYRNGASIGAFTLQDGVRESYDTICTLADGESVKQLQQLGNTIIISTTTGLKYALFKDGAYRYMGSKMPEAGLQFGLQGTLIQSDSITVNLSENTTDLGSTPMPWYLLPQAASEQAYSQLHPRITELTGKERQKGHFTSAFFVRYAYRTLNGYAMQSPPVLMLPNTGHFPSMPITSPAWSGKITSVNTKIAFYSCALDYRMDSSVLEELADWSDLIQSIDIFVSDPISVYADSPTGWALDGGSSLAQGLSKARGGYLSKDNGTTYGYTGDLDQPNVPRICPPMLADYAERVKQASVFWKVASIPLQELKTTGGVPVEGDILDNLGVQEVLPDGYHQHDDMACEYAFVYNQRLNLANVKRTPYGFAMRDLVYYTNFPSLYEYRCTVFLRSAEGVAKVESAACDLWHPSCWIYYPDPDAYRIVVERKNSSGTVTYADVMLTEHAGLNGAYYFTTGDMPFSSTKPSMPDDVTSYLDEPNKIYTSEVQNPFFFPLSGVNTVGVGKIIGISSTTRALSQGQFGQFPMLVFATDGIWAMEVGSDGLYTTKQPMSRDVCTVAGSITQLDGAVAFVSSKGVMVVTGGEVEQLSAAMNGPSFALSSIVQLDDILELEELDDELEGMEAFSSFIQNCLVAYDYPNQRILLFRSGLPYAYAYSLSEGAWATITADFVTCVSHYPDTYVQRVDGGVFNFSRKSLYEESGDTPVLLLTRPLKLGDDLHKSVNLAIQRGNVRRSTIRMVLFATTDGREYFPISSAKGGRISRLQGTPYRSFRLLLAGTMEVDESLSGVSLYITQKWRNRGR